MIPPPRYAADQEPCISISSANSSWGETPGRHLAFVRRAADVSGLGIELGEMGYSEGHGKTPELGLCPGDALPN